MTTTEAQRLQICRACKHSPSRCYGPCTCDMDMRDITAHAKYDYCPLQKFGNGARPEGLFVSLPPQPIPDDFDPEQERRRMQQGGCCGSPSKA